GKKEMARSGRLNQDRVSSTATAMRVEVVLMPLRDVQRLAIDSYNEQHEASENYASHKSDAAFLTRIAVNFIPHELTEYDHALADVAGKTGITKAVDGIRQKVYSAIAAAYPVFSRECQRQCFARQERHA